ncbi:MAG TPA: hypothetical protein PLQ66_09790 [Anaerolineae bacterium]|nr:hypothetical protein [Anaerolineae bacterium]
MRELIVTEQDWDLAPIGAETNVGAIRVTRTDKRGRRLSRWAAWA